jgi:hypothetical protein
MTCKKERPAWCGTFLRTLAAGKSVTAAATAARVSRVTVYNRRRADPGFSDSWRDAEEAAVDLVRDEIHRRSVEGWIEREEWETNADGQRVLRTRVRKWSDRLLILHAKKLDRTYRDNDEVQLSGRIGRRVDVSLLNGIQPIQIPGEKRRAAASILLQGYDDGLMEGEVVHEPKRVDESTTCAICGRRIDNTSHALPELGAWVDKDGNEAPGTSQYTGMLAHASCVAGEELRRAAGGSDE